MANQNPIEMLKHDAEARVGRPLKSPVDFDLLSLRISERISEQLSATTLKRLWGYISTAHRPRYSTLSTLSRYVGFADWDDYCQRKAALSDDESGFLLCRQIETAYLSVGDRIELKWPPDRRCVVIYNGADSFTVQEASNAKIMAGDTFRTMSFMLNHPLYVTDLRHGGNPPVSYVAGNRTGLSSIILLDQ